MASWVEGHLKIIRVNNNMTAVLIIVALGQKIDLFRNYLIRRNNSCSSQI